MALVEATALVPEGRLSEFYRLVSDFLATRDSRHPQSSPRASQPAGSLAAADGSEIVDGTPLTPSEVKRAYQGGASVHWRPFLDALADHADRWVDWSDLCATVRLEPSSAAGMIGAAERRCGGRPPYEKRWAGDQRQFRMPAAYAAVIQGQGGGEREAA